MSTLKLILNSLMNLVQRTIFLILLLAGMRCTPDISTIPYCPLSSGTQPTLVVRDTPMRISYTLVNNRSWTWIGFPELNDKFNLETAQRVRIWYRIVYLHAKEGSFFTRVTINGVAYNQFLAGVYGLFEHTIFSWDDVWLPKGQYYVAVQYSAQCTISDRPANHESDYSYARLKIEYLAY